MYDVLSIERDYCVAINCMFSEKGCHVFVIEKLCKLDGLLNLK